jgi:uncharacterized membrane-anchored protein YhcB (DUF1043 family)
MWRSLGPHQQRSRDLEKRLAEAERRLGEYQAEVSEHFVETSRRVNELTRNYKEVHEYLASSAMRLSNPAVGRQMQAAARISWSETGDRNPESEAELLEEKSERSPDEVEEEDYRSAVHHGGETNQR